jgi:transcriptional regulator with XRE-family HTH domain
MLLRLKFAIAARGLKQVDLALELRIPPSTLSEIINERRRPDDLTRKLISRRLGETDEDWLFSSIVPKSADFEGHIDAQKKTKKRRDLRAGL